MYMFFLPEMLSPTFSGNKQTNKGKKAKPNAWSSLCYAMLCYVKSLQSCPTLCDPIDGSPPGSTISRTLQERTLEWVAISCSNAWKRKVKVKSLSRVRLLATPWTAAYQAPPSMDFAGKSTGVGCHCLLRILLIGEPNVTFLTYQTKLGITLLQFHGSQCLAQHPS